MLDLQTSAPYKWQAPDALVMQGWRSNQVRSSPAMAKPYFRSNYAEVKTQFDGPFDNCVCIPLTKGHHALIDADDFDSIIKWKWVTNIYRTGIYAFAGCGKNRKKMHRLIANPSNNMHIDHINGNGLDNRRSNLREVTHRENSINRRKQSNTTSKYKGAYLDKRGKWIGHIVVSGKKTYLGSFLKEEDAAMAYDSAALVAFGDFANINFPRFNVTEK